MTLATANTITSVSYPFVVRHVAISTTVGISQMQCFWRGDAPRFSRGFATRSAARGGTPVSAASLFDIELRGCPDSASVLRVAALSNLPLVPADLEAFFARLQALRGMPRAGADLHRFVAKVSACFAACEAIPCTQNADGTIAGGPRDGQSLAKSMSLAVQSFAELRCRQGALATFPFLVRRFDALPPDQLSESIWAISAVPNPTPEVVQGVGSAARLLSFRLAELSNPAYLYRAVYGLARVSRGRGSGDFRRSAERTTATLLTSPGPSAFGPHQLVRFFWAFARLGSRDAALFRAFEPRLRAAIPELGERELEALYGVLTDLELEDQWRLIHDVELAMQLQQDARDPHKQSRKRPFRSKWTRVSLGDSVLPKKPSKLLHHKQAKRPSGIGGVRNSSCAPCGFV